MIEKIGSATLLDSKKTSLDDKIPVTKRLKTTADITSNLFCYKALELRSAVPPAKTSRAGPKARVKPVRKGVNGSSPVNQDQQTKKCEFDYDLWIKKDEDENDTSGDVEMKELKKEQQKLLGKNKVRVPCHRYQKPSLLPSVEVPEAGASYNPNERDHQILMEKAASIEEKKYRKALELKKEVKSYYVPKDPNEEFNLWMKEMSAGLADDDQEDDDEDMEGVNDVGSDNMDEKMRIEKKVPERKTNTERNKERQKKQLEELKKGRLEEKRKKGQEKSLKNMIKDIKKGSKETEDRIRKREKRKIDKLYQPKKLSGTKFTPCDVEVSIRNTGTGGIGKQSLRRINVEGNLLEDRFKSLQKRNIIECRVPQPKGKSLSSKRKFKSYVKRSHKDPVRIL